MINARRRRSAYTFRFSRMRSLISIRLALRQQIRVANTRFAKWLVVGWSCVPYLVRIPAFFTNFRANGSMMCLQIDTLWRWRQMSCLFYSNFASMYKWKANYAVVSRAFYFPSNAYSVSARVVTSVRERHTLVLQMMYEGRGLEESCTTRVRYLSLFSFYLNEYFQMDWDGCWVN